MDDKVMHCYYVPNKLKFVISPLPVLPEGTIAFLCVRLSVPHLFTCLCNTFRIPVYYIIFLCLISKHYSMSSFTSALIFFDITGHKHYIILVVVVVVFFFYIKVSCKNALFKRSKMYIRMTARPSLDLHTTIVNRIYT